MLVHLKWLLLLLVAATVKLAMLADDESRFGCFNSVLATITKITTSAAVGDAVQACSNWRSLVTNYY